MNDLRQAAQQAAGAVDAYIGAQLTVGQRYTNEGQGLLDALTALRAALAEPEQPVAWMYPHQLQEVKEYGRGGVGVRAYSGPSSPNLIPVYAAPTPRKPLTDEEIGKIAGDCLDAWSCARAIERAHGIGEQT